MTKDKEYTQEEIDNLFSEIRALETFNYFAYILLYERKEPHEIKLMIIERVKEILEAKGIDFSRISKELLD